MRKLSCCLEVTLSCHRGPFLLEILHASPLIGTLRKYLTIHRNLGRSLKANDVVLDIDLIKEEDPFVHKSLGPP